MSDLPSDSILKATIKSWSEQLYQKAGTNWIVFNEKFEREDTNPDKSMTRRVALFTTQFSIHEVIDLLYELEKTTKAELFRSQSDETDLDSKKVSQYFSIPLLFLPFLLS